MTEPIFIQDSDVNNPTTNSSNYNMSLQSTTTKRELGTVFNTIENI